MDLASILPFYIAFAIPGDQRGSTFLRALRLLRLFKGENYTQAFTVFDDVIRANSEVSDCCAVPACLGIARELGSQISSCYRYSSLCLSRHLQILSVTGVTALITWIFASTCMYYAEVCVLLTSDSSLPVLVPVCFQLLLMLPSLRSCAH